MAAKRFGALTRDDSPIGQGRLPRILHIISTLDRSGAEKQLLLLARGLAQRGVEVHVAALERGGPLAAEFRAAGIPVTVIGQRMKADPVALARLVRHVAQLRPELVHTWNCSPGVYGRIAAQAAGVKHVVAGEYAVDRWKSAWAWFVDRRLVQGTDRFVTNSAAIRDHFVEHGMPGARFATIANAVEPAPASNLSRAELLEELDCPANARLIGVVGSLVPQKRVKDLIWAADLLRVLHDNLRLLVIGDGPERSMLERFARLASDLDHVRLLGHRDDVWRIMPHLDVLWNGDAAGGQSNAVMEAMAAGVPVVASDVPANGELIVHGESGFLVPIAGRAARARATDQIFNDPGLKSRLGAAAKQRMLKHFSVDECVQRHEVLYRELLL